MTRWLIALAIAVLATLTTTTGSAQAQACADGRGVTPATAGRCCWPGQSWDDAHGRCSGPPSSCPEGTGAAGDACVALMTRRPELPVAPPQQTTPAVEGPTGAMALPSPVQTGGLDWPHVPVEALDGARDVERYWQTDGGLQALGVTLFISAYLSTTLPQILLRGCGSYYGSPCVERDPLIGFAALPLLHWAAAFARDEYVGIHLGAGISMSLIEGAALAIFIAGSSGTPRLRLTDGPVQLSVTPQRFGLTF